MRLLRRLTPRPPRIFLSYRRRDSKDATRSVYQCLVERFGNKAVFMDTVDDRPTKDFVEIISSAIPRSDCVIAIIGPHWNVNEEGVARLHDKDDFVRMEVRLALERRVPILPVFVDGAGMTPGNELPPDIAPVSKAGGLAIHDEHFDDDIARVVDAIDDRIVTKQGIGSAAIMILLAILALVRGCDFLEVPAQDFTMIVGDATWPAVPDPGVLLVGIDQKTSTQFDGRHPGRLQHAQLVDTLVKAGVATIAFDMHFTTEDKAADPALIAAFKRAEDAHVRVIITGGRFGDPVTPVEHAATALGLSCLGRRRERAAATPIVAIRNHDNPTKLLLSLGLLAAYNVEEAWWRPLYETGPQVILGDLQRDAIFTGSWRETVGQTQSGCNPVAVNDDTVVLMRRLSRKSVWEQPPHRIAYEDLVPSPKIELAPLKGAVVIIGDTDNHDDESRSGWIEVRPNVMLQADTISNLMQHQALQPMSERTSALIALLAGALGWIVRRRGDRETRTVLVPAIALLSVYAIAVVVYLASPVLVSVVYPVLAFGFVYLLAGRPFPRVVWS